MRLPIDWTVCRLWLGVGALMTVVGCGDNEQIRRYQVPHEPPKPSMAAQQPPAAVAPQRSLAAIVPHDGQAWFFKALGPAGQIQTIASDFERLLKSVSFSDGKPQWSLPVAWTQSAGNQFRYATLKAGPIDVAVSSLPLPPGGDFNQYLLANVNRWRGQISLPDVTASELASVTREVALTDGTATLYDSGGDTNDSGGDTSKPATASESEPVKSGEGNGSRTVTANGLTYEVPEGWEVAGQKPMRLATFLVNRDAKQLEITLSRLGANPGSMLANVNRWRGQIGLGDIDQAELDEQTQTVVIDGADCPSFELDSPQGRAIYVVVAKRPDSTLFIKMMGDRELAADEKATFQRFAESIRFNS